MPKKRLTRTGLLGLFIMGAGLSAVADSEYRDYEIGLSMYSLRDLFKSGELTPFDFPQFAKDEFGITKIDVWDGVFPKNYKKDPDFLPELKRRADAAGVDIFLVMTGMIVATSDSPEDLEQAGMKFKLAVDQAEILGADYVRVFIRGAKGASPDENLRRFSAALTPLADYGLTKDVMIVIEPNKNAPLGSFYADLMVKMQHPNVRLMPDFGKMLGTNIYQGTANMLPYSPIISAKAHNLRPDGSAEEFDYPRLMRIINESEFSGIIAIEYEGKKPGPVAGVHGVKDLIENN